MATTTTSTRHSIASRPRDERITRRKKDQRSEIWTNLLRQTREAQARSRTQAIQTRDLVVCGGSPEDQRAFVQTLTRPPPPQPPGRNPRDQRERRPKGEVVLSNRFAYGYGHVTLFSPPPQGAGILVAESEEIAKVGVHTVLEPDIGYEETLRRLLRPQKKAVEHAHNEMGGADIGGGGDETETDGEARRPAVVLLLSWKEPWKFLELLRLWLQLLSRSLLLPNGRPEDPMEVLKEHGVALTVVVQHVEAQEQLERENYKEESFDYISQCLRTCLLPLSAALIYTPSAPAAQPSAHGTPLSEIQKVIYTSLGLDLAALSPASTKTTGSTGTAKKEESLPKHNVVDRMAIVVPSGWDSLGKIRLLSETFSPEAVLGGWMMDVNSLVFPTGPTLASASEAGHQHDKELATESRAELRADDGVEQSYYEATGASSPVEALPDETDDRPLSPSKMAKSAIVSYEQHVQDPQAHKAPQPPRIEVTTKPEQEFLAEMRSRLQQLDEASRDKKSRESGGVSSTAGRGVPLSSGESSGALHELGDINFNVGGVNYNAVTAEAAIERLKRPAHPSSSVSTRPGTPRFAKETPKSDAVEMDRLEEYFHSLMKRGGGGNSTQSTPSKLSPSGTGGQ